MGGTSDQVSGRIKQAAGDLTGDEDLEREGEREETAGQVKDKVGDAADAVNDKIDDVKDQLNGD